MSHMIGIRSQHACGFADYWGATLQASNFPQIHVAVLDSLQSCPALGGQRREGGDAKGPARDYLHLTVHQSCSYDFATS